MISGKVNVHVYFTCTLIYHLIKVQVSVLFRGTIIKNFFKSIEILNK